jgi:hypothetical protein
MKIGRNVRKVGDPFDDVIGEGAAQTLRNMAALRQSAQARKELDSSDPAVNLSIGLEESELVKWQDVNSHLGFLAIAEPVHFALLGDRLSQGIATLTINRFLRYIAEYHKNPPLAWGWNDPTNTHRKALIIDELPILIHDTELLSRMDHAGPVVVDSLAIYTGILLQERQLEQ